MLKQAAKADLANRDEAMDAVENKFERGLFFVGGTAVEDRLQDEVRSFLLNFSRDNRIYKTSRRQIVDVDR